MGAAESFALVNNCEHSWIAISGDDDFHYIPPKGMAVVPTRLSERFGAGCYLQTLAEYSQYCPTSLKDGSLGCATGILIKRGGAYHSTHPLSLNDKDMSISDFTFQANDVVTLECTWERYRESFVDRASISLTVTGCDAVTLSGILSTTRDGLFSLNMAFPGNTVIDFTLPYPASLKLQPWSRAEPGWLEGTYSSVDGTLLANYPWIDFELEDQGPHRFEFVCNHTKQDPPFAMTNFVYSTMTTITTTTELETTTDVQWSTFTQTDTTTSTQTKWSTTTDTLISTSTETQYEIKTETQYATGTCNASSTDVESSTTSESSTEPTPSLSPSAPSRPPNPSGESWQIDVFNRCPLGSNFPVIFTQPQVEPDGMAFTQHSTIGLVLKSEVADPTFFPIAGGQLCVTSQQTFEQWCGYGTVTAHATVNREVLNIDCPFDPPRPALPDLTNSIPLNIRVGSLCSFYAVQIGCEDVSGAYCLGKGFENVYSPNPTASMQYPKSNSAPGASLRVRVTNMETNEWQMQYVDSQDVPGANIPFEQRRGNWLELVVPDDATGINLQATCYYY